MNLLDVLLKNIRNIVVVIKCDNKLIYVPRCKWIKVIDYKVIATERFVNTTTIYLENQDTITLPPITNYYIDEYYGGN